MEVVIRSPYGVDVVIGPIRGDEAVLFLAGLTVLAALTMG